MDQAISWSILYLSHEQKWEKKKEKNTKCQQEWNSEHIILYSLKTIFQSK